MTKTFCDMCGKEKDAGSLWSLLEVHGPDDVFTNRLYNICESCGVNLHYFMFKGRNQ